MKFNHLAYTEPELTVVVLDYQKPFETAKCLDSIKRFVKIPHKVIYCHNGIEEYPYRFFSNQSEEGEIDVLIMNRHNVGLGIGTRNLMANVFSEYVLYLQNDQFLTSDLTLDMFSDIKDILNGSVPSLGNVKSVSLAGAPCGCGIYSERAHIIKSDFYKSLITKGLVSFYGAGPWHNDGKGWAEGNIQDFYKVSGYQHLTSFTCYQIVMDFGCFAVRQNGDGSIWCHRTDTKKLWHIDGVIRDLSGNYPKFTDLEKKFVLSGFGWPDGKIPQSEVTHSFEAWKISEEDENKYIENLRNKNHE